MTAVHVAWYACTTSRNSSGSSCCESAVEPTRSQNITVNWRRSASGALGTAARGAVGAIGSAEGSLRIGTEACSWSAVLHSPQNLACGAFAKPHRSQRRLSAVPHSLQNFSPSEFSNPQLAQCILLPSRPRSQRARETLAQVHCPKLPCGVRTCWSLLAAVCGRPLRNPWAVPSFARPRPGWHLYS